LDIKKVWNKTEYNKLKYANYQLFKKWFLENNIKKLMTETEKTHNCYDWRWFLKKGMQGLRSYEHWQNVTTTKGFTLWWDHIRFFLTIDNKKILVSQPYLHNELDEDIIKLKSFCNEHNFKIKIYDSKFSWYYPNYTKLIQIKSE
jgi:hypothetical protein